MLPRNFGTKPNIKIHVQAARKIARIEKRSRELRPVPKSLSATYTTIFSLQQKPFWL
jgi:hypothetical protein